MQDKAYIKGCFDCGKPYEQVLCETTADYLHQTTEPHEITGERLLKRRAFKYGRKYGVFTFVHRGVPQSAICDGQVHDMRYRSFDKGNRGTRLPLFQNGSNN